MFSWASRVDKREEERECHTPVLPCANKRIQRSNWPICVQYCTCWPLKECLHTAIQDYDTLSSSLLSTLTSICKACQPNKPASVHFSLMWEWRQSQSFDIGRGPHPNHTLAPCVGFAWGEHWRHCYTEKAGIGLVSFWFCTFRRNPWNTLWPHSQAFFAHKEKGLGMRLLNAMLQTKLSYRPSMIKVIMIRAQNQSGLTHKSYVKLVPLILKACLKMYFMSYRKSKIWATWYYSPFLNFLDNFPHSIWGYM